jgi:hypothetical protein
MLTRLCGGERKGTEAAGRATTCGRQLQRRGRGVKREDVRHLGHRCQEQASRRSEAHGRKAPSPHADKRTRAQRVEKGVLEQMQRAGPLGRVELDAQLDEAAQLCVLDTRQATRWDTLGQPSGRGGALKGVVKGARNVALGKKRKRSAFSPLHTAVALQPSEAETSKFWLYPTRGGQTRPGNQKRERQCWAGQGAPPLLNPAANHTCETFRKMAGMERHSL